MYWNGTDVCDTLTERNAEGGQRMPDKQNFNCVIDEEPIMMSDRKGHNGITEDGTSTTLTAQEKERPIVADIDRQEAEEQEEANRDAEAVARGVISIVRRLTPIECERLQGMPDDWSKYGINEKGEVYELPDSARYRLQGNGIATPFFKWVLKRISAQYERDPTMGSLFSGQSSFEWLWESINGRGTAVWCSEIDKHAIAVSKKHFGDEDHEIAGDIKEFW